MGGRPTNTVGTITITVSTTPQVKRCLEKLVRTGTFGKSPAEAAERIISEKLWALASEGKGLKMKDLEDPAT